ncbi:hypothetical protein PSQ90_06990 [Devosia rhodophyticola]|uniref:Uncharacterized protein n=1 Tax=Devosia rhodophyticola TaxID=3026423 RepID=A0ABY7Z196_9HYPH|nr:hypothetical protein [Devosia rhodophyticola]WDR07167.1 hypothetical protein PSQ90_06990 [Devosia rhodophyticola]
MAGLIMILQIGALVLLSLVVGSMFGIWRGYEVAAYRPETFIEVHQGAVRGLNTLLPALAALALALCLVLGGWLGKSRASLPFMFARCC